MLYPLECFLIDDDIDDQEIFGMALQELDRSIRCIFANDGVLALEKLSMDESFIPDYIFIDFNMPRMNGIKCLEEIKKTPRVKHVPVFLYSTSADPEMMARAKQMGASDFIIKPASISTLSNMLGELFNYDKRRSRQ